MTGQLDGANLTRQPRRAQVWYTSDLHIGHRLIAGGLRGGFDDSDDHDAELARRWDNDVSAGDTVWVLGDISAGGRGGAAARTGVAVGTTRGGEASDRW